MFIVWKRKKDTLRIYIVNASSWFFAWNNRGLSVRTRSTYMYCMCYINISILCRTRKSTFFIFLQNLCICIIQSRWEFWLVNIFARFNGSLQRNCVFKYSSSNAYTWMYFMSERALIFLIIWCWLKTVLSYVLIVYVLALM